MKLKEKKKKKKKVKGGLGFEGIKGGKKEREGAFWAFSFWLRLRAIAGSGGLTGYW
jgi:hypothetical protein